MRNILTRVQFENAICLDFEGEGPGLSGPDRCKLPYLAGIYTPKSEKRSGSYQLICFRDHWRPVANGLGGTVTDFNEYFSQLAQVLETNRAHLIYWSVYEEEVLGRYLGLDSDILGRLHPWLYNLKLDMKPYRARRIRYGEEFSVKDNRLVTWHAALHPQKKEPASLDVGAAETCRRLDRACARHKRWRHFSEREKAYARNLITYNRGDCLMVARIARKVVNVLN